MIIDSLRVPPFNTTLMGVLRGVADHYQMEISDATLYGASAHAFLINIHEAICPSGPYCWRYQRFTALLANMGIGMVDLGFFGSGEPDQRAEVEAVLRDSLDAGIPVSLLNMENQLLNGYDDTGFITTQPWPPHDFPPAHLTFGSWEELGDEIHINFFRFQRVDPVPRQQQILESLETAIDMWRRPMEYTDEGYGVGPRAYELWIAAAGRGEGKSHGNWWNATVWSECRQRAAEYFTEIAAADPQLAAIAAELSSRYQGIASVLQQASDKEMEAEPRIALLQQARGAEEDGILGLERLAATLGAHQISR
jgi:hypothetical protein